MNTVGELLPSWTDDLDDLYVVRLAVALYGGITRLSALSVDTTGWAELIDAGLLQYTFTAWARQQYSVMITEKGAAEVMTNIAQAASITAKYDLYDVSEFFIARMASGDLPEFLSHEVVTIREAAAARLEELSP